MRITFGAVASVALLIGGVGCLIAAVIMSGTLVDAWQEFAAIHLTGKLVTIGCVLLAIGWLTDMLRD